MSHVILAACEVSLPAVYAFSSNTFTPAGKIGRTGPSLAMVRVGFASRPMLCGDCCLPSACVAIQDACFMISEGLFDGWLALGAGGSGFGES